MSHPIIDAHQHFWNYDPARDLWMTDEMLILKRDYLPQELENIFKVFQVNGSVLVQADPSEAENGFMLNLANQFPFIKGIVGWMDMQSDNLEEKLEYYQLFPKLKGFRHMLQGEKKRDLMLTPAFRRGISLLNKYGFSFDLLILNDQVGYTEKLVRTFPDQRFVIDHLAKPAIKKGEIAGWKHRIKKFSDCEHVYCKISGMISEADWEKWDTEDFRPYLDAILETFGTKRIMFGSDWPVCRVAGEYAEVKGIVSDYFKSFSVSEQADFFGNNALHFYQLT
jgi:L-fuconolactonase